jgi:hypothetical protein
VYCSKSLCTFAARRHLRSPDAHVAFHAFLGAVATAARRLTGAGPDRRVFVQNLWAGINSQGQGNVGHTHPFSTLSGVLYLDHGWDDGDAHRDCGDRFDSGTGSGTSSSSTGSSCSSVKVGSGGELVLFDPRSAVTCSSPAHRATLRSTHICPRCNDDVDVGGHRPAPDLAVHTSPLCSRDDEDPLVTQSTMVIKAQPGKLVMFPCVLPAIPADTASCS